MQLLSQENENEERVGEILAVMGKIVSNIANNSYEIKYKTLKKSNKMINQTVYKNPPCLLFLNSVGFMETDEVLELQPGYDQYFGFLWECMASIVVKYTKQSKKKDKVADR